MTATNDPTRAPGLLATPQKVAFAALKHRHFRGFFFTTMLAMMADNIEHVISYWVLFEKFQSPVLGRLRRDQPLDAVFVSLSLFRGFGRSS